jgi:signal peptidase I
MASGPSAEPDGEVTEPQGQPAAPTVSTTSDDAARRSDVPSTFVAGSGSKKRQTAEHKGTLAFLKELPVLLLVAFVLALVIKTFLVQAFYIPSASMENTLQIGDRVLVNKLVYHLHPPRRGDIIVFEDPHPQSEPHRNPASAFWHWLTEGLGVSNNPQKDFIKRVIGLPGDTVEIVRGQVLINGTPLHEPYLNPVKDLRNYGPVKVPKDNLFVMGDNRTNSNDSRFLLGYIPYDKVIGRAFVIIWPPSRVRWLHGL